MIMAAKGKSTFLTNQKGLVILESIPLILVMFVLLGATLGSWGIVHTAIMNSIASRHNAFFVLNHRSELAYKRDFGRRQYPNTTLIDPHQEFFTEKGRRFFFVQDEDFDNSRKNSTATLRFVNFIAKDETYDGQPNFLRTALDHRDIMNQRVQDLGQENRTKVAKAWIMVAYGICLTATCGD